jgi:hypothetical protein
MTFQERQAEKECVVLSPHGNYDEKANGMVVSAVQVK